MSNPVERLKIFEGILSSQSYDLLKLYRHDGSWNGLAPEEKEVLAQLFLLSAEKESLPGDPSDNTVSPDEAYRCACRLAPNSARSWYRFGVHLAFQEDIGALQEASFALSQAVALDAGFFDAQHALASVSLRLGLLKNDEEFLLAAEQAFVKAAALLPSPTAQLYWHWGLARLLLAQHSGEPLDYMLSFELYEKADSLGIQSAEFLADYAHAAGEVALRTSNMSYMVRAGELLGRSLALIDPSLTQERALRHFQLGLCYEQLYEHSHEETSLQQASWNFSQAVSLDGTYTVAYERWGQLLFASARLTDKKARLEEALEKFKNAEECGSLCPLVFAQGALSLLYISEESDRIDVVRVAHQLGLRSEELAAESSTSFPDVFAALALSQIRLGRYFSDENYLVRATDIIRDGLSKHQDNPMLWHILGIARILQAQLDDDEQPLEEALAAFSAAAKTSYASIPSLWTDWGAALALLGEWTESKEAIGEAIAKFEMAKSLGCEVTSTWVVNLALMYDTLSLLVDDEACCLQAIDLFETLITNVPDYPRAMCYLGVCHSHLGQMIEEEEQFTIALSFLEQYLEDENEDEEAWLEFANALVHRGFFYKESEDVPQDWFLAEEVFFKVLALGNDAAYYHLATLYALFKDASQALYYLNKALEKDALPPPEDIVEDEWLSSLFSTPAFDEFIQKARGA